MASLILNAKETAMYQELSARAKALAEENRELRERLERVTVDRSQFISNAYGVCINTYPTPVDPTVKEIVLRPVFLSYRIPDDYIRTAQFPEDMKRTIIRNVAEKIAERLVEEM